MSRRTNKATGTLAALLVAAALTPSAGLANQDLRSPDARDGVPASGARPSQDLRSPDARDVALASQAGSRQDVRSPDAADPYSGVPVQVVEPAPVVNVREVDPGFDWGDAGLGAGALLTLALLVMAGSVLMKRHGPALS